MKKRQVTIYTTDEGRVLIEVGTDGEIRIPAASVEHDELAELIAACRDALAMIGAEGFLDSKRARD